MFSARSSNVKRLAEAVSAGADIECKDESESTALILAARCGDRSCLEWLISAGADLEAQDNSGFTALIWAALRDADCVAPLVNAGANFEFRASSGVTPLLMAASAGQVKSLQLLIEAGADVNVAGWDGVTPLQFALRNRLLEQQSLGRNRQDVAYGECANLLNAHLVRAELEGNVKRQMPRALVIPRL